MIVRRRSAFRWGYRLGAGLAYFTDPVLGAERRNEVLGRLDALVGTTRVGPMIAWLQELNEGRIGPLPSRRSDGRDTTGSPGQDTGEVVYEGFIDEEMVVEEDRARRFDESDGARSMMEGPEPDAEPGDDLPGGNRHEADDVPGAVLLDPPEEGDGNPSAREQADDQLVVVEHQHVHR